MKKLLISLLLLHSIVIKSQNILTIVPMPAELKMGAPNKFFTLSPSTIILIDESRNSLTHLGWYLQKNIMDKYGFDLKIRPSRQKIQKNNFIELSIAATNSKSSNTYNFNVTEKGISIVADKDESLFQGIQTLFQLISVNDSKPASSNQKLDIPLLHIKDYPRFPYRGMHLDVGRHFFPVSFLKKYIDYLAAYKYNTFHWHLTEDQGWRIEIKKYPNLTKAGACRDRTLIGRYGSNKYDSVQYCGYYTQEEVKEIIRYAADRYITVIPEIEMPGHSMAALTSYPYLGCTKGPYKVMDTWGVLDDVYCAGNDSTFTFLQDVLDEVIQLFPSKYIHIGGDECPKERWKKCKACQLRMKNEKIADEHALQSYFIKRIEKYLNSKGRKIIGWDEILEGGLAPNATVMSWRGEEGGIEAAKKNHDVIMTPGSHCYLDHSQSKNEDSITIGGYLPLEKVYSYEPIPAALNKEQAKHVLGAQGNVWTEYMKYPSKVEYMIFPRMIALSEVLWSPKEKRNWKDFERRLPFIFKSLDRQKINYSKSYYDLKATILQNENYEGIKVSLESKLPDSDIRFRYNTSDFYTYSEPVIIGKDVEFGFAMFKNGEPVSTNSLKFKFNRATGRKISLLNPPHKSYLGIGAFTLVDGIQNERGMAKSAEFLGFLGQDMVAMIDLRHEIDISKITVHVLDQNGSWIYLPMQVEITYIPNVDFLESDLKNFPKAMKDIDPIKDKGIKTISIDEKQKCRYLRIVAKNYGIIPSGSPGAGNPAWLFVDEIEVE